MGRNNRVTLADIASRANVDISTVSLVLNHKARAKKLTAETSDRVFAVAKELNYRPSYMARASATSKPPNGCSPNFPASATTWPR